MSIRPTSRRNQSRTISTTPYSTRITSRRVYVGNLAWEVQWQDLKDHCRQAGTVVRADIITDSESGRSKGYGIVEFSTIQDAENAIETLRGTSIMGRPINIREDREEAKSTSSSQSPIHHSGNLVSHGLGRKVYVQNLSFDVVWQELKDFLKQAGNVVHVDILSDSVTGRSKGCGIAEFATSEDARRAITTLNELELKGRKVYLREDREEMKSTGQGFNLPPPHSQSSQQLQQSQQSQYSIPPQYHPYPQIIYQDPILHAYPSSVSGPFISNPYSATIPSSSSASDSFRHIGRRLYVNNLAYEVTWQDLKDHFRAVVPVLHVEIFSTKDGKSKGCGIVELSNSSDAITAIGQLNNSMLKGRPIFVREDRDESKT